MQTRSIWKRRQSSAGRSEVGGSESRKGDLQPCEQVRGELERAKEEKPKNGAGPGLDREASTVQLKNSSTLGTGRSGRLPKHKTQ